MGQASSSLPDDVTSEILLRLPADSIGRLRCVSKSFLSLTTDPHFIRTHSSISTTSPVGFYFSPIGGHQAAFFHLSPSSPPPSSSDPSLSFLDFKGHPAQIMHYCNGLILCRLPDPFIEQQRLISLLSVCNPTTREHDVIPVPENLRLGFRFSLAFDPSLSLHFEIVAMRRLRERNAYCMHRFSSETRSWKLSNDGIPGDLFYHWDTQSIFCNGALCWKALDGFTCFDVGTEKFNHIRLPAELLMIPSDYVYYGGSGGRLQCLKTCGNAAGPRFKNSRLDIFETEPKSSSEWSLLHSVDLGGMVDEYPEAEGEAHLEMMVLWFCHGGGGGGDEVGDRLVLSTRTKIVAYHFKTRKFSTICSGMPSDMGMYRHRWRCVYPQANTLVPLNASTTPQQDWVCWKSGHDKLLVSLMVEDSLSRRENKLDFTNAAWDDMVKKFNGATKLNYEVDHLKNRLKSYTRDYKIISRMLRRRCSSQNIPVPQIASSRGLVRIRHRNDEQRWTLFLHQRERITFEYLRIIHSSSVTSRQEISSTTSADVEKRAEEDVSNNDHAGTVGNQDVHSVPMIEAGESSQDAQGTLPLKRKMM